MRPNRPISLLALLASSGLLAAETALAQPAGNAADVVAVGKLERPAANAPAGSPCVLRVTSVAQKPSSVSLKPGDTMAVVGEHAQNCTAEGPVRVTGSVVSLGNRVTVHGTEIQPVAAAPTPVPLVMAGGPSEAVMSKRLEAAELVVQGRVTEIRNAPVIAAGGARPKVSEHDPMWKEAVVQVLQKVKGEAPDTVVVRFPSSRDVAFRDVPKFKVGETATLLLSKGVPTGPITEAPTQRFYVAPSRADVLPPAATPRLRQMLNNR